MTAGFPSLWRPTSDLTTGVLRKVAQRPAVAGMRYLLTCGSALAATLAAPDLAGVLVWIDELVVGPGHP